MFWDNQIERHNMQIKEEGDTAIVVNCLTCKEELARFSKRDFPKYRIAFYAAVKAEEQHACERK